jgi:S-DNA-T family DNA segregation ATPase FtsK/SpoIIIE
MSLSIGNLRADGLIPPAAVDFLKRRLVETGGIAVAALALAVVVALLSFDPADPSLNSATDGSVRNLLGRPGAYGADLALQSLGAVSLLLALVPLAWAWRLVRLHSLDRWWLRLALLPAGVVIAAIAFAALPAGSWRLAGGLGGFVGQLLLPRLAGLTGLPEGLVGAIAGGLAVAVLFVSAGIAWSSYRAAAHRAAAGGRMAGFGLAVAYGWVRGLFGSDADEDAGERRAERRRLLRDEGANNLRREPRLGTSLGPALDDDEDDDEIPALPARRIEGAGRGSLIAAKKPRAKPGRRGMSAGQATLDLVQDEEYALPPLDLLEQPPVNKAAQRMTEESLEKNARLLESVLEDFGVRGQVVKVRPGPVVTLYEFEPAPGTKTSRVVGLADDVARSMSAVSVRIAVVPGRSVIGIELPNQHRETVYLRELLASEAYERTAAKLSLVLGKDIGGAAVIVDLARMPHLLIAGTTGSGKSVAINTMILSLLYRLPPDQCKFIMIDPKMLELSVYDGIPHLLTPVVTEPRKAIVALKWTVREMEQRYRAMSKLGVRNIEGYNQRVAQARASGEVLTRRVQTGFDPETGNPIYEDEPFDLEALPFIVVVVDEMADLMLVAGKDIEAAIQRLAQMARAAGIHIIMATQRPSVDVITGTIKANFPTRVSFHVTSRIDSRTILGETGAEQLLGQGDMLYMAHGGRITRVHGPFVGDREVESIVQFLKQQGEPTYMEEVTRDEEEEMPSFGDGGDSGDALYDQAVALVCRERKASTSFVQRHLQIGYNRAARLIERMEKEGVVSQANHVGKRDVLGRDIDALD